MKKKKRIIWTIVKLRLDTVKSSSFIDIQVCRIVKFIWGINKKIITMEK